jgi:amino acid transporter
MSNEAGLSVFSRKASGLVKSAGPFDVFTYNFGLISVGIAVTLAHLWVPANYAGASLPLAEILAGLFMAGIAWAFWCWSVVIPRSGGVYAFVSRGLSPGLGFAISFVDTFTWLFYNALAATFVITIGIGPALFVVGFLTGSTSLVNLALALQSPAAQLTVGATAILFAGLILAAGMRTFFIVQKVLLVVAGVGTLTTVLVLATTDHDQFRTAFDAAVKPFIHSASNTILDETRPEPWSFSLQATLLAAVWPILSFVGSIFSVNIGGEVRNFQRSQLWGMFGSLVVAAALMAILSIQGDRVFGYEFQAALGTYASREEGTNLPLPPNISLLAALSTSNPLFALLICLGFLAWAFFWIPATMVYATRALIAWSFDRVAPAGLGDVHPTRQTPVRAVVVVVVVNLLFLALFLFVPFFGKLILVLATMLAWIPTMLGAVVFPFLRREMYLRSPLANCRLLGLPVMSIAGTLGLVGVSILTVLLWNDPVAAGHSPASLATIGIVFAIGLTWYFAARALRLRQGLRIDRAFTEIPIE